MKYISIKSYSHFIVKLNSNSNAMVAVSRLGRAFTRLHSLIGQ
jgi:hypothetical protein